MSKKVLLAGGLCILLVAAVAVAVISALQGDIFAADEKVITTASGLKYADIKVGDGKEAKEGSTVLVFYTGTLENGKQFDSNVGKDPFEVTIGKSRVIKGWTEGLQGMKAGSECRCCWDAARPEAVAHLSNSTTARGPPAPFKAACDARRTRYGGASWPRRPGRRRRHAGHRREPGRG